MTLKFLTSVTKGLKLKVKVLGTKSYVCRSYRGKTGRGGGGFLASPILNRVNILPKKFKGIACVLFLTLNRYFPSVDEALKAFPKKAFARNYLGMFEIYVE